MRSSLSQETVPVYTLEVDKTETRCGTVDEIIDHLRQSIDRDPLARYVGVYDHHEHTSSLEEGWLDPSILAAQSIVFCFGLTLPSPQAMALRPRSIGVSELFDRFVISFAEAPMPVANLTMERWSEAVADA